MGNVEVSIIVPVYNNEKYLKQCLDSIINQTFKDIEIILVDDGSTDKSASICDEYAKKDNRILIIHSENNGVSNARNIGIDKSQGKFIMFCDSDDWLENDYIESHYNNMISKNVDIVHSGIYRNFYKNNILKKNEAAGVSSELYIQKSDLHKYLEYILETMEGPFLTSYAKIYKSDIIKNNNIYFDTKMIFHEDFDFTLRYLQLTESIYISKDIKYYYRAILGNQGLSKRNKANVIYEVSKYHKELNNLIKPLEYSKNLRDYIEYKFVEYYKLVLKKLIMIENDISKSERDEILSLLIKDNEFCEFVEYTKNTIRFYKYLQILINKKMYSIAFKLIKKRL